MKLRSNTALVQQEQFLMYLNDASCRDNLICLVQPIANISIHPQTKAMRSYPSSLRVDAWEINFRSKGDLGRSIGILISADDLQAVDSVFVNTLYEK